MCTRKIAKIQDACFAVLVHWIKSRAQHCLCRVNCNLTRAECESQSTRSDLGFLQHWDDAEPRQGSSLEGPRLWGRFSVEFALLGALPCPGTSSLPGWRQLQAGRAGQGMEGLCCQGCQPSGKGMNGFYQALCVLTCQELFQNKCTFPFFFFFFKIFAPLPKQWRSYQVLTNMAHLKRIHN